VSRDLRTWLLLDLNRWVLAAAVLGGVYAAVLVVGALDPVPLPVAVERSDPVETLFQALLTAVVTGVTLVVTVNQLVLSQELGAVGDQRERMAGATEFRRETERVVDAPVSPADPADFLRTLVETARDRADALAASAGDDDAGRAAARAAADLRRDADDAAARLSGARFGTFETLRGALAFDYPVHLHAARRLRAEHGDALPAEAGDALDGVVDALSLYGPAREHVKTLYFQWELIELSRAVLYAAVPALAVTVGGVLALGDAGTVTGRLLGVDALVWVVGAGVVVALAPFALLLAHVLRIATVAKRTLAIGPFVLRSEDT
jgi:hypothetical protein